MKKILLILLPVFFGVGCEGQDDEDDATNPADMPYDVVIDPSDFLNSNITGNAFFPITPGTTYVFEGEDEDGLTIRVETEHTLNTKMIMGITCIVINDREYEEENLIEDTFDWYAQDKNGNMWYFGEESKEIENGEVVNIAGSWEAGIDGALPGIIMLADPIVGLWYRQEYYEGEVEDVAQVLSISESVSVPLGSFTHCLQTVEWSLLEQGVLEHKYYAEGIGVIKIIAVEGESGYEELIEIISGE